MERTVSRVLLNSEESAQRGFFWRGRGVIGFETQEAKSGTAAA
jgi:hypothetical protein